MVAARMVEVSGEDGAKPEGESNAEAKAKLTTAPPAAVFGCLAHAANSSAFHMGIGPRLMVGTHHSMTAAWRTAAPLQPLLGLRQPRLDAPGSGALPKTTLGDLPSEEPFLELG